MSPSTRLARFASTVALLLTTAIASGQTADCAVPQGNTRSLLPQHSANLIYVAASNDSRFLYGMTQFGWVRAPLADPLSPAPLLLGQHGQKFSNGGIVPMICDCWQMGTTMAFAEAPDGSARVFFDNNASGQGGGLPGQVGRANGTGPPGFGQQIDLPSYASGVGIAAVYLPASGKFVGYLPGDTAVNIVDGSNPSGDPSSATALRPFGSLNWGGFVRLKAARIQVPSLAYDKHLLVGGLGIARQIRIAEIDGSTGLAVERASVASVSEVNTIDIATVGSRIFVFSAEGTAGLQIYEYTPSGFGGSLTRVSSIPGDVNPAVVRGGQFPAIFMHRQATPYQSFIDVYDTKFLTQGGQPRKAYSLPHAGAPQEGGATPAFLGRTMDAVVRSSGGIVTAYVYRVVQKRTGENEDSVRTDKLDISCISADLTTPPVASSNLVNVSAQGRSGAEATRNYFGDRWQIRDTSASGAPLDQIEWDFNVVSGQFAPNESAVLPGAASEVNPAYFPCDPSNGGNIRTGANCHLSLGNPASGNFSIGNRTHNSNGWSPNTFISAPKNVIAPQAHVAGFDGTTLRVLSGGQASAAGSQGNISEASVAWAFNPGSIGLNGVSVTVPTTATSFWVDVNYRGGYMSRVIGNVQQVDLVPDFTLAPNPVLNGGSLTLTNTMQISGGTTLNGVTYSISPGGLSGSLPASFRTINGTGPVTAPGTTGAYTITLTYSFSGPQGANQDLTIAKNFSTTSFAPNPVIGIYSDQNRTQTVFCQAGGCYVDSGRTYYFFDEESIPQGISHPGTQWTYVSPSGEAPMGTTPAGNAGPLTYTFGAACATGCSVRVSVGGVTKTVGVVVSSAQPPPPPPPPPPTPPPTPPPGGFSVALSGPSSGSAGTPISFTAIPSGGVGTISYAWRWGDNALSLNYQPGPATNSYTYPGPGQFTVAVRATDSAGTQANASFNVTIGAPSGPPLAVTVSGPSRGRKGQPVSFTTAVSGGVPPYSYAWRWGDSSFGAYVTGPATHAHVYDALGTFNVSVRVTDSAGVATTASTVVLIDEAFQALLVPGAAWLKVGDDTWGTDVSVANPGTEPVSLAVAFVPYLTESAGTVDLAQLSYRAIPTPLAPNGGSWSQTNVVQWLGGRDTDKGTLVLRYEGPTPVVNGRVYFAKSANPLGPAYGAPVESFKADASGRLLAAAGTSTQGIEAGGDQTLIGLRSTSLYRFGLTLYNSSGVETRAELRAFDETGAAVNIITDDAGNRGPVREVRIRPYQQAYLRNQDLGLPQDPNKRYVFRASKVSSEGSLVAFGAAIDTKTSDLEQFTDDTPAAVADERGSVYLYIPGASRFNSGNGAKWRTELRAYNPANVERTLAVEYLYVDGLGQAEKAASATRRVGAGQLLAFDDVIGTLMDEFTPDDLKTLSTTGLLRISYFPGIAGSPMIFGARNYDDQVAGTAGTQLAVYSRSDGVSASERPLFVPGAQEDSGEGARLRTTLGVFAMDNRQTRVRVSVVRPDGTVPANGAFDFVLNQTCSSPPCGSGHMAQIFMDRNSIPGLDFNQPLTIKTEVLEGGRAGVYVVTVDTSTRDTSFKAGRPVR